MIKDLPASVRQRLENAAKKADRPFHEILQYFGMERFLYRLSQSKYADRFILKGALMFSAWSGVTSRATKDEAASQLQKERPQRLLEVVEQELVSRGESSSP